MSYIDGFVAAVPLANRQAYLDHARAVLPLLKAYGATRMVENWGDDVPEGKITDFHRSVRRGDGEAVAFSWIEWPSRQARDAGMKALMQDERMKTLPLPFDGQRMIFGGFAPIFEKRSLLREARPGAGYVDGFVVPVPAENREAYARMVADAARVLDEYGASCVVEGWGDDVPDGKVTDFRRAVGAKNGETIVFSWIEWPSRQARDDAWPRLSADPRMQPDTATLPFDGQRAIRGGFATLLDA